MVELMIGSSFFVLVFSLLVPLLLLAYEKWNWIEFEPSRAVTFYKKSTTKFIAKGNHNQTNDFKICFHLQLKTKFAKIVNCTAVPCSVAQTKWDVLK